MKFHIAAFMLAPLATATLACPAAHAQAPTDQVSEGTYQIDGGGYQITVRPDGSDLVVVEPNKESRYQRQSDGTWHFRNPVNGILYGLRRIDAATIEAFKPDQSSNVPTRLSRIGGAPRVVATPLPPSVAAQDPASVGDLARTYQQRAQADPNNAQTWSACAAAAHKRFLANPGEADAYGAQMASLLKTIIVDAAQSPCPDAIPQTVWNAGKAPDGAGAEATAAPSPQDAAAVQAAAAEAERVRQLNELADQRARALEAERQRQIAEHAKAVAEADARQAQFERDRQAYEAAKAASDAAADAYCRQIEEYERAYGRKP